MNMNMQRTMGLGRIFCALAVCLWLTAAAATAATYTNDTDWGGADLTLVNGDVIAGIHTNIGHFAVAAGATATVQPYGPVLSDPVYSNEVVIGYAATNYYGWARIYAVSGTVAGTLSANAAGYPAKLGPETGVGSGGAGYGGRGTYGNTYGSADAPDQLGSGGGEVVGYPYGGAGGGAVLLQAVENLIIDGTLSANGGNGTGRSGGGSGGSLWLMAARIAGGGTVTADGGSGSTSYITAAGGGRIAFDTPQNEFNGIVRAKHGSGRAGWVARNGTFNFKADADLDLVISNDIALPPGTNWVFKSLIVTNGAVFEMQSTPGMATEQYTNEVASRLRIIGDVTVASGCVLSADGQGYWVQEGPGAGTSRSSAGYGGFGSYGYNGNRPDGLAGQPYGMANAPDRLGSGGGSGEGSGNAGGGAIILDVLGKVTVEGTLSANGARASYRGGGGSGGSVWIKAGEIRGKGLIAADGGGIGAGGYSGGGGGGRIAFETDLNTFIGSIRAQGQPSSYYERGRHGTFNFKPNATQDLVIRNAIALSPGTNWLFKSLTVTNGATFEIQSVTGTAALNYTNEVASRLRLLGDVTVASDSSLSVDGLGYLGKKGPGAGNSSSDTGSGGGGYGGAGGFGRTAGGGVYGSPATPDRLGSGGGNKSNGGGALILNVGGKVIVQGTVSATGDTLGLRDGGGSGGSIWIKANGIEGLGKIVADGGNCGDLASDRGGGGGGGRIAIEVVTDRFTGEVPGTYIAYNGTPNGSITVAGGLGGSGTAEDGAPGTFYLYRPRGTVFMIR